MRPLVLTLALVALGALPARAQAARVHSLSDAVSVSLPGAFDCGTESDVAPGVDLFFCTKLGTGRSVSPNTYVTVTSYRNLSPIRRFFFKHGFGLHRSLPQFSFDRVPLASLPLSGSLAASAGSAFASVNGTGSAVGTIVRGCDGDLCYSVGTSGPADEAGATAAPYADLLAGLQIRP